MTNRIPTDWQPDCRVYKKAAAAGMNIKWVKEQLARFIEITEDTGQSLNRHFDNFLLHNHDAKQHTRPQPEQWESRDLEKTDPETGALRLKEIREAI